MRGTLALQGGEEIRTIALSFSTTIIIYFSNLLGKYQ
jgi:hypothetical protein